MSDEIRAETLDYILEYTQQAPEHQLSDASQFDTRIVQVLGAGSIVIGLASASTGNLDDKWLPQGLFAFSIVTWVLLAVASVLGIMPRLYRRSFHADILWNNYWQSDLVELKHALVHDIAASYAHNKLVLQAKRRALVAAVGCLSAEVLVIGLALLISSVG